MTNVSKIGEKIKIFRKKLGLQANKLAEQLNISPSYLNLIENGKRKRSKVIRFILALGKLPSCILRLMN